MPARTESQLTRIHTSIIEVYLRYKPRPQKSEKPSSRRHYSARGVCTMYTRGFSRRAWDFHRERIRLWLGELTPAGDRCITSRPTLLYNTLLFLPREILMQVKARALPSGMLQMLVWVEVSSCVDGFPGCTTYCSSMLGKIVYVVLSLLSEKCLDLALMRKHLHHKAPLWSAHPWLSRGSFDVLSCALH